MGRFARETERITCSLMPQRNRTMAGLKRFVEQVNHSFEEFTLALEQGEPMEAVETPFRVWQEGYSWLPVDVIESPDEIVVKAELPGYQNDDVELRATDRTLRIEAEHTEETEPSKPEDDAQYVRRERRHTGISRSVTLPDAVDEADISAEMNDGVLSVSLSKLKPEESDPTEVEVSEP